MYSFTVKFRKLWMMWVWNIVHYIANQALIWSDQWNMFIFKCKLKIINFSLSLIISTFRWLRWYLLPSSAWRIWRGKRRPHRFPQIHILITKGSFCDLSIPISTKLISGFLTCRVSYSPMFAFLWILYCSFKLSKSF